MADFTKAKWVLDEHSGEIWADRGGEDFFIAHVMNPHNNFDDECSIKLEKELEANARLVVSAPELYAWLVDMLDYLAEFSTYEDGELAKLKARGRELRDRVDGKEVKNNA